MSDRIERACSNCGSLLHHEDNCQQRRRLDFYETPAWQTRALLKRVPIAGRVFECCAGDSSLADELEEANLEVRRNDIDLSRKADWHFDATERASWEMFGNYHWVITNPPFNCAMDILKLAHEHAVNVAMLLRLSFLEPTKLRAPWLCENLPVRQIVLPRWSYKQNGKTDSVTTAWFVWAKDLDPKIQIVGPEEKTTNQNGGMPAEK